MEITTEVESEGVMEPVGGIRAFTADTTNAESNSTCSTMATLTVDVIGQSSTSQPDGDPASDTASILVLNEGQHVAGNVTENPFKADETDEAAQPIPGADRWILTAQGLINNQFADDICMPDAAPSVFEPICEHPNDANTSPLHHLAEIDVAEGEAMDTTSPEDPDKDEDDVTAYGSDPEAFKDTNSDEDDDLHEPSLANYIAMERRLAKGPRITKRGHFDSGSDDDCSSSEDDDSSDDYDDVDEEDKDEDDDTMERKMEAAMNEELNLSDEVTNIIANADGEEVEVGNMQPEGSQTFGAEHLNGHSGAGNANLGPVSSLFCPPDADLDPTDSATEGYKTLANGMLRATRHLSDNSSEEDSDDQKFSENSDNFGDGVNATGMFCESSTFTDSPADLEDDEIDMEDIFNDLVTKEPLAPPKPPPQPNSKPKHNTRQGTKRSLDEMRVACPHGNSNEPQLVDEVSNGGSQLPFVPTRLKLAVNRGPRGAPRRADPVEVRQVGPLLQHSKTVPAVSATKPPSTLLMPPSSLLMPSRSLPVPSTSLQMPTLSLPMPSSSLPMPIISHPPVTINQQRESTLAVPQPANIDDAQVAMIALMTAAKRSGVVLFETRVAADGADAAPGAEFSKTTSDKHENIDMDDHSWMDFEENPADEDIEYLELAMEARCLERKLLNDGPSPEEQFKLVRMKEDLKRLEKREPERKRTPPEKENRTGEEFTGEEGSEREDGNASDARNGDDANPEAEELRGSKRRKFAQEKQDEALAITIQRENVQPADLIITPRRPRIAREVHEQQANRGERAFFEGQKKNNEIPLHPPKNSQARKKLFKNMLATQPNDGRDDVIAKVLQLINPTADAITQRLEQGEVPAEAEIRASTKAQQLADLVAMIPADLNTQDRKLAKAQMAELRHAAKNFGFGKVKARNGRWYLDGMKTGLYHHQLDNANWMVSRELALKDPKGGILADAMGLGKTVTTLACIVGNPPQPGPKNRPKPTLVVVPASLLKQWEDEVEKHVRPEYLSKAQIYKKSSKLKLRVVQDCDIVITTYAEILSSWNVKMSEDDRRTSELIGADKWRELNKDTLGILHQISWYRVVLGSSHPALACNHTVDVLTNEDEAHHIKNYQNATAQSCFLLDAEYRWCLTGTPMLNSLDELYPYLRFLKVSFTSTYKAFKVGFANKNLEASQRLSVLLRMVMKRRTFGDLMLGKPLIVIPPPISTQTVVKLTKEEVVIYRLIEEKFRNSVNQQLRRAPEDRKDFAHMLSKLLRLRQAVAHPFLLESVFKSLFDSSDIHFLRKKFDRLSRNRPVKLYDQIKQWVLPERYEDRPMSFGVSNFGARTNWDPFLSTVNGKRSRRDISCVLCNEVANRPHISNCHHIFCKDCIEGRILQLRKSVIPHYACPQCETLVSEANPFLDGDKEAPSTLTRQAKSSKKAKDNHKPPVDSDWLRLCEKNPQLLLPSSKTIAIKAQMVKWLNEAPDDKIIIFTQFRVMARVIGLICDREKVEHVYFTGDMSHKQRETSVKKFHEDKKIKVMIANLKCGGVGLNLACANRVISVDPWWNHATEQQAFARVFRLGQTKTTHFVRLFAEDTVDYRIRSLQKDKITAIDEALTSGKLRNLQPLSLEEIAGLFGQLVEEEDGKFQVQADYVDDFEGLSPEFNDEGASDSDDA